MISESISLGITFINKNKKKKNAKQLIHTDLMSKLWNNISYILQEWIIALRYSLFILNEYQIAILYVTNILKNKMT